MSESTASPGSGMKLHTKILLGLIVSLSLGIVNLTIGEPTRVMRHLSRYFRWL